MTFSRKLLFVAVICLPAFAGHAQSPGWKSTQLGKISLQYPPGWQMKQETQGGLSRITLTPDSMQNLSMRMIELYDLPVSGTHTYTFFKENFAAMIQARDKDGTTIRKTAEISFKDHKTMYAEIVDRTLPAKVYGINNGTEIYMMIFVSRRHSWISDPGMERDEMGILNSITFGK